MDQSRGAGVKGDVVAVELGNRLVSAIGVASLARDRWMFEHLCKRW